MHDAAQRTHGALNGRDDLLRLFAIGDIRPADHHLDAPLPQSIHRGLRRWRGGAAADQRQVTCAASRQAVGNSQSETAETAGDQVAGVGVDRDGRGAALQPQPLARPAWRRSACRHAWPAPCSETRLRHARPETRGAAADADHCFQTAPALSVSSDRARSGSLLRKRWLKSTANREMFLRSGRIPILRFL